MKRAASRRPAELATCHSSLATTLNATRHCLCVRQAHNTLTVSRLPSDEVPGRAQLAGTKSPACCTILVDGTSGAKVEKVGWKDRGDGP